MPHREAQPDRPGVARQRRVLIEPSQGIRGPGFVPRAEELDGADEVVAVETRPAAGFALERPQVEVAAAREGRRHGDRGAGAVTD